MNNLLCGAGERTRTSTPLRELDFESSVSAIPPHRHILKSPFLLGKRRELQERTNETQFEQSSNIKALADKCSTYAVDFESVASAVPPHRRVTNA